jgi:NNP family nitrate/nitrite transporter-like MFS transporter
VGQLAPPDKVGTVTGMVGAAGGLGGFLPPLLMGGVYALDNSYAIGLMLLSDVALAAAVFTWLRLRRPPAPPTAGAAGAAGAPDRAGAQPANSRVRPR